MRLGIEGNGLRKGWFGRLCSWMRMVCSVENIYIRTTGAAAIEDQERM